MEHKNIKNHLEYTEDDIRYYVEEIMSCDDDCLFMYPNKYLVEAVYSKIKGQFPAAKMYKDGVDNYICLTKKAEKALMQRCRDRMEELEARLNETRGLLERLETNNE